MSRPGVIVEQRLGQSVAMFGGNWLLMFTRPIALVVFALTALALFAPPLAAYARKRKLSS